MAPAVAVSWSILILIAAPIAGILARRPLAAGEKSRLMVYAGGGLNLILIGAITAAIDLWRNGIAVHALSSTLRARDFIIWSLGVSAASILISIGIYFLRAKLNRPPSAIVMWLLPDAPREYVLFLILCVLVGVVEEFLFRGFAFFTLTGVLQNNALAIAIVTISFALQHGIQDAIGIIRAFVLGAVLAVPVLVTGSLLPSIAAHAIVDMFSGLYGRSLMERFGVVVSK